MQGTNWVKVRYKNIGAVSGNRTRIISLEG